MDLPEQSLPIDKEVTMMTFVFRNHTVEPFLGYDGMTYSGYDDISEVPRDVDRYIWFYQVPVNADSTRLSQEIASYSDKLDYVLSQASQAVHRVLPGRADAVEDYG